MKKGKEIGKVIAEIQERIGICKADNCGNITELRREFSGQGWIFKDWEAFREHPDAPCYVPELEDVIYTGNDFMALCSDEEEIAEELFDGVDWQNPSALMEEWERAGEIDTCRKCGKLFLSYHVKGCPHCRADVEV